MAEVSPQPNVENAPASPDFTIGFWLLVVLTGAAAGLAAGMLMKLLRLVQHLAWRYQAGDFLDAVEKAPAPMRILVLAGAGFLAGLALVAMKRVKPPRGTSELEATIWFHDGRLPPLLTILKAVLSIVIVALGASLGREAAPKQIGALLGSLFARWRDIAASRQRLLAACGAGAGIAAVYNVPFGGALFTLEVLLGTLALPLVAPAFVATLTGTAVCWLLLGDAPSYRVPPMPVTPGLLVFAALFAPLAGIASGLFVKAIAAVARLRPRGWDIVPVATLVFTGLGLVAVAYPQVLGNGKGIIELAALDRIALPTLAVLMVLKPLATAACLGTGAPGGLFTPTIASGALIGAVLGHLWLMLWPDAPPGAFALLGGAAVLAATTKGPVSAIVLFLELTRHVDGLMVPLLIVTAIATLVAHRIDPRSTYTSRLPASPTALDDVGAATISAATRYAAIVELFSRRDDLAAVDVVDDEGGRIGALRRTDILSPPRAARPLEIAAAVDFVEARSDLEIKRP